MITTIQKWGNSQGIRLPKVILETVNWSGNEELVIKAEHDKLIIEKAEKRKNIKELFSEFDGEYTPLDINWGEPTGEEIW